MLDGDPVVKKLKAENARLRAALREAREAWQEQLDFDLDFSCLEGNDGKPDLSTMDPEQKEMIEELRTFIAHLTAELGDVEQKEDRK